MKKLISIILTIILLCSLCACSGTPEQGAAPAAQNTTPAEQSTAPAIENPDLGRSREELIAEARSYIFPAEGKQDIDAAIEILLPLVEEGDAEAQYYFAYIYDYCLEENDETEKESLYWYELAMEQGYLKAYLGVCLNKFVESQEKANELAGEAIELGLLEMSDTDLGKEGGYLIGSLYENGYGVSENYTEAFKWFNKSAEAGFVYGMATVGNCYYTGFGVEQNYEKAIDWFTKGADEGNGDSLFMLGNIYFSGNGVTQDYDKAYEYFLMAAEAGHSEAMGWVGAYYEYKYSNAIKENPKEAYQWYSKAAEAGYPWAMSKLGDCYANSYGVGRDYEKAMEWYINAYLNGYEVAGEYINTLLSWNVGVNTYYERYEELLLAQAE